MRTDIVLAKSSPHDCPGKLFKSIQKQVFSIVALRDGGLKFSMVSVKLVGNHPPPSSSVSRQYESSGSYIRIFSRTNKNWFSFTTSGSTLALLN